MRASVLSGQSFFHRNESISLFRDIHAVRLPSSCFAYCPPETATNQCVSIVGREKWGLMLHAIFEHKPRLQFATKLLLVGVYPWRIAFEATKHLLHYTFCKRMSNVSNSSFDMVFSLFLLKPNVISLYFLQPPMTSVMGLIPPRAESPQSIRSQGKIINREHHFYPVRTPTHFVPPCFEEPRSSNVT